MFLVDDVPKFDSDNRVVKNSDEDGWNDWHGKCVYIDSKRAKMIRVGRFKLRVVVEVHRSMVVVLLAFFFDELSE